MFKHSKLVTAFSMAGLLFGLNVSAEVDSPSRSADPPLRDGELRIAEGAEVAHLHLSNGSSLYFVEVAPGMTGVLEMQAPGVASISSVTELGRDATPTDVFFAFSEEGTEIPERLIEAAPPATFGPQGWARGLVNLSPVGRAPCNDADVRNYVNSFGYNDRGTPNFRLNQKPESSSYFDDYVEPEAPGYYFYEYKVGGNTGSIWSDVDRYLSYVAVCAIDSKDNRNPGDKAHPAIVIKCDYDNPETPEEDVCYTNSHMGPQVRISYRRQNTGGSYTTKVFKDFAASEVGTAVYWHFYTGTDWDWRTEIHWAGGDDSFDIAHAVEDL